MAVRKKTLLMIILSILLALLIAAVVLLVLSPVLFAQRLPSEPVPLPQATLTAQVTQAPAPEPTQVPTPEPTQEPTPEPTPQPLAGRVIGLDPGHQAHANSEREPVSPGSSETKKKVSSGTEGVYTKVPEYEVNLAVALLLRDLLTEQGATVLMTHETADADISNVERAQLFNDAATDYALRLHCNGTVDPDRKGAFMLVPAQNPYKSDCDRAARLLLAAYCEATGADNLGVTERSDQTGFNWCGRMIINIEMGHMSNEAEDILLTSPDYQRRMAQGLLQGILAYFD